MQPDISTEPLTGPPPAVPRCPSCGQPDLDEVRDVVSELAFLTCRSCTWRMDSLHGLPLARAKGQAAYDKAMGEINRKLRERDEAIRQQQDAEKKAARQDHITKAKAIIRGWSLKPALARLDWDGAHHNVLEPALPDGIRVEDLPVEVQSAYHKAKREAASEIPDQNRLKKAEARTDWQQHIAAIGERYQTDAAATAHRLVAASEVEIVGPDGMPLPLAQQIALRSGRLHPAEIRGDKHAD